MACELGKKSLNGKIASCKECTKTKDGYRFYSGKCNNEKEYEDENNTI